MQPLVSVVMPSLNQARFIERAVSSVLSQSWQRVELIVQDGSSSDGTQAILERIHKKDGRLSWMSRSDHGPAEAINSALQRVRGTYIGWLNADDEYTPGAIERAVTAMQQNPQWMLCYGQGEHIDEHGKYIETYPTLPTIGSQVPNSQAFQHGCFICQPTVFFKAVMATLIGKLDSTLGASFDFDYWLRAFNAFPGRIGCVTQVQAYSRIHPDTITQKQRRRVAIEGMSVLARHLGSAPGHWLSTYLNEQRQAGVAEEQLQQEAASLLEEVKNYMRPEQWQSLSRRLP